MRTVCVIGAGPAGLVGAKTLLRNNFNVTVFEKANRIGGIWALDEHTTDGFLHPNTPTNLSKFTVGFSDLDWNSVDLDSGEEQSLQNGNHVPKRAPMFPRAWHANRYLETYRQRYIPEGIIKLGHEVVRAECLEHAGEQRWRISTRNRQAQEQSAEFDYLLLASGFFAKPRPLSQSVPALQLQQSKIKVIHSSEYRKLEDIFEDSRVGVGKKILVIGGGNSAGEVAAAVAQDISNANHSPETGPQELYRDFKIIHVTPRPLYAVPPFSPCDDTSTTFTPLDLKLYDLSKRPEGPIVGNAGRVPKAVKDMIHGAMQSTIGGNQSDLGASALTISGDEPRSTVHAALSETYAEFVRSGLIDVVAGRVVSIEETEANTAVAHWTLGDGSDGDIPDIGAIIYATGYTPAAAVQFLPEAVKRSLEYDPNSLRLPLILQGWQTTTPAVPNLSFLGFYEGPYWPIMEMQARLTAYRWLQKSTLELRPYEEPTKLLDLRRAMQDRGLDVPQYWFGDYAGYLEEIAAYLGLQRNDGVFAEREGCVSPARYLSVDSDKAQSDRTMLDLGQVWHSCTKEGKFVARAVFRALHGNWSIMRTITSALSSFPSGTLEGSASFHPRSVTSDESGQTFDLEYLYVESGKLVLSNGASMPVRRRYVYRYSEERDELSVWFLKPDSDYVVDYLFHKFLFVSPAEARQEGACIARADHPCEDDMYFTEYRLPMRAISLLNFQIQHKVRGPGKDYVATTMYRRVQKEASMPL